MTDGPAPGPLAGTTVLVTRERPGELARLLTERGADVVHLPLITTVDPPDGGVGLAAAVTGLVAGDWLLVTSAAGAERAASYAAPGVRLGAVGTVTAERLSEIAGRPVDVVPERQLAAELAEAVIAAAGTPPARIVVAQADRAAGTLAAHLRAAGHTVTAVTAYRTIQLTPTVEQIDDLVGAIDVLALASGSAAYSWVAAIGSNTAATPHRVVAIGPSTAEVCRRLGLRLDGVADEHTMSGLVAEIESQVADQTGG